MTASTNNAFNAEEALEEIFAEYWDYEQQIVIGNPLSKQ